MALSSWTAGDIVRVSRHLIHPGTMQSDPWANKPVRIVAVFSDGSCEIRPVRATINYRTGGVLESRMMDPANLYPVGVPRLTWERTPSNIYRAKFGLEGMVCLKARRAWTFAGEGYGFVSEVFGRTFYGPTLVSVQLKAEAHLRSTLRSMVESLGPLPTPQELQNGL